MNKSTIIAIAVCIIGIGLIIIGLVGIKGKWNTISKASADMIQLTYECRSSVDSIVVSEKSDDVTITVGNVSAPVITYYVQKGYENKVEVGEYGGKLKFERKDHDLHINFVFFNFGTDFDQKTVVTVPKNFRGNVELETTSGRIKAEDLEGCTFSAKSTSGGITAKKISSPEGFIASATSGEVDITDCECRDKMTLGSTSGRVSANNIDCSELEAANNSGGIKLEDVNADSMNLKVTSGSIRIEDIKSGTMSLKSTSGTINMENVVVDEITCNSTSGGVHFSKLDAGRSIVIGCNSGSVRGSIKGKESDFSIITSTNSGSSNLKDSRSGSKTLDISTTSGGIKVDFD